MRTFRAPVQLGTRAETSIWQARRPRMTRDEAVANLSAGQLGSDELPTERWATHHDRSREIMSSCHRAPDELGHGQRACGSSDRYPSWVLARSRRSGPQSALNAVDRLWPQCPHSRARPLARRPAVVEKEITSTIGATNATGIDRGDVRPTMVYATPRWCTRPPVSAARSGVGTAIEHRRAPLQSICIKAALHEDRSVHSRSAGWRSEQSRRTPKQHSFPRQWPARHSTCRHASLLPDAPGSRWGPHAIPKSDHRARAYEDGLEESVVHPANALKADCAHELGDLCHRDREIGALQDGGVVVNAVHRRDLERIVISRSPPAPDLAEMIAAPRPGALAVRSHLNRPGRRRWSVVAH